LSIVVVDVDNLAAFVENTASLSRTYTHDVIKKRFFRILRVLKVLDCDKSREGSSPWGEIPGIANYGGCRCLRPQYSFSTV